MELFKELLKETKRLFVRMQALQELIDREDTSDKARFDYRGQLKKFRKQRENILQRIIRMRCDELGVGNEYKS